MKKFIVLLSVLSIFLYASDGWCPPAPPGGNATRIQGVSIATTAPTNGYVLKYNSGSGNWEPAVDNTGAGSITFDAIGAGTNANALLIGTGGSLGYSGTGTISATHYKGSTVPTAAEFAYLSGVTSAIQTQIGTKSPIASPTFTGTVTVPSPFTVGATSVTATGVELNYSAGLTGAIQTQLNLKSPIASPTFTGTVTVPSPFVLGATSVTVTGAEINFLGGASSNLQTQITARAPLASPTFTGTVTIPTPFTLGAVSVTATGTQLNYVAGVTSAIQTQLNLKSTIASPTFTGTVTIPTPFTLGAISVTATGTELNYVAGVTSAIQTQMNLKSPIANPTFTGKLTTAPSAVGSAGLNLPHGTAPSSPANGDCWTSTVGLYCYINGSTIGPFATASGTTVWGAITGTLTDQTDLGTALGLKAPVASPTFTGKVTTAASAAVAGAGFRLPHGIVPDTPADGDCWTTTAGLYCRINGGTIGPYASTVGGVAWGDITGTLSNQTDLNTALGLKSPIASPTFTGTVVIPTPFTLGATSVTVTGTEINYLTGTTSAIQTQLNAKAPTADPTFTGAVVIPTPFTLGATSVTATGTQLNYVASATGTTGTTNTNLVFSASPTFTGTVTLETPFTLGGTSVTTSGIRLNYLGSAAGTTGTTSSNLVFSASPTVTGVVVIPTPFTLGATSVTATGTQLNYLAAATGTTGTATTNLVFSTSPTLVTPVLGAATATSINGLSLTALTDGFSVAGGTTPRTLTVQTGAVTLTGNSAGSTLVLPSGSLTLGAIASGGWPGAGIANSTGSAWGTSYSTSGTGTVLALVASPTFTGDVILPSSNADPASTAGALRHDSTVANFTNGALVYYNGAAIKQLIDMTTATAQACTDAQVVSYDATADLWKCVSLGAGHTQNTDTGTTSTTFQIDSGNTGPKLKNNALTLEVRNAADNAYAPLTASQITTSAVDGSNALTITSNTAFTPTALMQLVPVANLWKFNENGTLYSAVMSLNASPIKFSNAITAGGLIYGSATNTASSSGALTPYGVIYAGSVAGNPPVAMTAGTTGQVVAGVTGGAPIFTNLVTLNTPSRGGTGVPQASDLSTLTITGAYPLAFTLGASASVNLSNFASGVSTYIKPSATTIVPIGGDINTYITAATAGDTLILSSGTYTITAAINVNKAINIVGQGHAGFYSISETDVHGTRVYCATSNVTMFNITVGNVRLANMSIHHDGTGTSPGDVAVGASLTGAGGDGLTLTNLDIVMPSSAGIKTGISLYGFTTVIRDVAINIIGTGNVSTGIYAYNDSSTTSNKIIDVHTTNVYVTGGSTRGVAYEVYNNNDNNTLTMNLFSSQGTALNNTAADYGAYCHSTTTNNAYMNIYQSTLAGGGGTGDYDLIQTGTNSLAIYGGILVNNATSGTITYGGTVAASIFTGTITNAANVAMLNESTDTTCFPAFLTDSTPGNFPLKTVSTLTLNSNTGLLSSTGFGVGTGGITMVDAANIAVNTSTGSKIGTATNQKLGFFNSTPVVQQTGDLVTGLSNLGLVVSGTVALSTSATNAVNVGITDDYATAATMYPTWVTTTTGNLPQKISSTKLSWRPDTGILTATEFAGAHNGTVGATTPAAGVFTTLTANALSSLTLGSTTGPVKGSAIFWGATSGSSVLSSPDVAGSATAIVLPSSAGTLQLTTGTPAGFIIDSQAIGDLLYASSTTAWSRLGIQAAGYILAGGTTPGWSNAPQITTIELGAAADTTLARVSAGVISVEGVTVATVGANTFTGVQTFTPAARTSGALPYFKLTIPTDTGQTAATESPGFQTVSGTRTWATTGTVALQREFLFAGPTYASASASQTFTDAITLAITPPIQGTNAIFTRAHSLAIVDSTSAATSITGGLVVATALGTAATSVGIGGGNINAGGTITAGGAISGITSIGPGTVNTTTAGTGALPFTSIFIGDEATNNVRLTNTAAASAIVVTLPSVTGTLPIIIASGATALDFASTATGACATVIQAAATGVATTDVIIFNPNASIKAVTGYVPASTGGFSITAFPTSGYVNFEACNWTAGTVDPASITVNWMVIR
jgi:hypothetical protein